MKPIDMTVEALMAALMTVLLALVFGTVIFRYILGDPLIWSEELGRFCLVWVSFLGAYIAHRRVQHIAVTVFVDKLPKSFRLWIMRSLAVILLAFLAILSWQGSVYALRFMSSTTPLLNIPVGLIYAAMPISMTLIFINVLLSLFSMNRQNDEEQNETAP